MCGAEYTIELEDDEEFDIKKVQLVKYLDELLNVQKTIVLTNDTFG